MKPQELSIWRYIGTRDGRGELHSVVFNDPFDIVTCALKHGWRGPLEAFKREFEFVSPPPPILG